MALTARTQVGIRDAFATMPKHRTDLQPGLVIRLACTRLPSHSRILPLLTGASCPVSSRYISCATLSQASLPRWTGRPSTFRKRRSLESPHAFRSRAMARRCFLRSAVVAKLRSRRSNSTRKSCHYEVDSPKKSRRLQAISSMASTGIHLKRDNSVSVKYSEGLNSTTISATHQRADRHGILGQKSSDYQLDSGTRPAEHSTPCRANRTF